MRVLMIWLAQAALIPAFIIAGENRAWDQAVFMLVAFVLMTVAEHVEDGAES